MAASSTDTGGATTTYGYDSVGNLTQITDPAGRITQFGFDASHRVTSVTRVITGGNAVTTYDYTTPGHTKVTDADGHPPVDYTIDGSGRVTATTDAFNRSTATTYTPDAKVGTATSASNATTTNTFGANNGESLTLSQQGTTGAKVSATYNAPGQPYLPDSVTDTMSNASAITYSGPGNLASTTANAAMAQLTYNTDGTVATAIAPNNATTTYVPNGVHQLGGVTPPAGGSLQPESFTYDGAGRLKTAVTGAGVTTTYTYDGLDRVKTEVHTGPVAAPDISYGYDTAGNLSSRSDATGTTGFIYDEANRLKTKNLAGGATLSYTYDGVGNLATATDAAGTTTYHYNKANQLDQITEVGGRTDVFAYDADHRRTDTWDATNGPVTYDASGNNVIAPTGFAAHIHASFDSFGHLIGLKTTRASSDAAANRVADLSYSYAVPSGTTCAGETPANTALRQSVTDNVTGAVTAYCYDGGARLTSAATGGGPTYAYGYDVNGNRTSGPEGSHTFNAVNQATDASSVYDANGNLSASTAFPTLANNGVNQTTSITATGQSPLALAYAGTTNDQRTSAGPTTYQNGLLGVQSQASAGSTSSFVRDPQGTLVAERIGTDEYYFAFDGLGSVIALIDASGTQRAAYSYDPYGGHATATAMNGTLPPNPWRYAGGALDATTGLYHFGARYYDPAIGRWTQQDSVDSVGDPGNANRYAYAGDDPVNVVDPSGRNAVSDYLTGNDDSDNPLTEAEEFFADVLRQVPEKGPIAGLGCLGTVAESAALAPEVYEIPYVDVAAGAGACALGAVGALATS